MKAEPPTDRFRRLFADTERELLAYALRRVNRPEDAADVVAETFLVAWRRLDRVPPGDDARLWLYGVARRQLARLEEEDREILRLSSWEELAPSQIAAVMGLHDVTVRSRLHRARKRLRAELLQFDTAVPTSPCPTLNAEAAP